MDHRLKECYSFVPDVDDSKSSWKRSKTTTSTSTPDSLLNPFVPLIRGQESSHSVERRYKTFEDIWRSQETAIARILLHANNTTTVSVKEFVKSAYEQGQQSKIPTGLLMQGPENSASVSLFDSLAENLSNLDDFLCITLTSGQSPNLKTVLRYINQAATSQTDASDEANFKGKHKLNYDLQILHDHVNSKALSKVVLLFEDSEAFEGDLLSDLVDHLSSWNDRIPFVLLFGIATSTDLFESKLSRTAIRCLDGKQFDVEQVDIEYLFKTVHSKSTRLFLGPGLSKLLIERQKEFLKNVHAFVQALKYAYMTHFFSNPFSMWIGSPSMLQTPDQGDLIALRHLPSFRRYVQQLIDAHQYEAARRLLDDDVKLHDCVLSEAQNNLKTLRNLVSAVDLLFLLNDIIHPHDGNTHNTWSNLYILAMSDKLSSSGFLEDILASLKTLRSDVLQECFKSIRGQEWTHADPHLHILDFVTDLAGLITRLPSHTALRSGHDIQHSNLRTTVVAHKVELSRYAAELTAEEAAYTKVIDDFVSELRLFFRSRLVDPQEIFLHEVFIYDAKPLLRETFMPRPRFAIERALNSPHDYLGCDCCDSAAIGLSASQPATAIVYQLYLESGNVINTADLWSAFWTIVGVEESQIEEEERQKALALFSRALAELKYLGLIKNSKKKADHLAKLSWKGL